MKIKKLLILMLSLILLLLTLTISSNSTLEKDNLIIEIPGGINLISKILGINNVYLGKDFIWLLTNYLCRDILFIEKAKEDIKRENFRLYLDLMNNLSKLMKKSSTGFYINLDLENEEDKKLAGKIFNLFGYSLKKDNNNFNLSEISNDNSWLKHLVFILLGYSPENMLQELNKVKKINFSIPIDYVELPFEKALIEAIFPNEKNLEKNFLYLLAENVNFNFLLLSLYNLNDDTINAITKADNKKISSWRLLLYSSDKAGWKFYRISPYVEANSINFFTPIDRKLLKGPSGIYFNELSFLKNWMNNSDGKFAYLMRGLFNANPAVLNILIANEKEDASKSINLLYYNLNLPRRERLSQSYDLKELDGFPEVLYTLKYKGKDLYFPAGYDSWLKAIKNNTIPTSYQDLIQERNTSNLSYLEFFKELSKWKADDDGQNIDGIATFFRIYNFFLYRNELATPENVILLFRSYPYFPAIIPYLEHIKFSDPNLLNKIIFKVLEIENIEKDNYEKTVRIFQSTLSLFWILSLNPNLQEKDLNYLLESFLSITIDKKYGYNFEYAKWFNNVLLKYLNCNENIAEDCLLNYIVKAIPQNFIKINEALYLFNPREREKEQMQIILKEQNIPSYNLIRKLYEILSHRDRQLIIKKLIELKEKETEILENKNIEEVHQINQDILNLLHINEQLGKNETDSVELILKMENSLSNLIGWYNLGLVYAFWMKNINSKAFLDKSFIAKHDFSKLENITLLRTPWRNTKLVIQDPKKGIYLQGSLSLLPLELAPLILQSEFTSPNSKLLNNELPKWLWASSIFTNWNLVNDETNYLVASLYELGIETIKFLKNNSAPPSVANKLLPFLKEIIGKPRYIIIENCLAKKKSCENLENLLTPSELFFIGKYLIENSIEFDNQIYKELKAFYDKDPEKFNNLNQYGAIAPHIIGSSLITINYLPPYEKLEKYYTHSPIAERLFDYKIRIAFLINKLKLPSILQYSIWQRAILYILSHCRQNYIDDWESIIWQTQLINEESLQRWIQEFKAQGYLELE